MPGEPGHEPRLASHRAAVDFVVRRPDGWWWAPVPGGERVPTVLADVLARLSRSPSTDRARPAPGGLGEGDVVAPVWMWIGRLGTEGVTVEGRDGSLLHLDPTDLTLLDALTGPCTVGELATRAGLPAATCATRLARLADAGRVESGIGEHWRRRAMHDAAAPGISPTRTTPPPVPPHDTRIPVYAPWPDDASPLLSLGMLTAYLRHAAAPAVREAFDVRRPAPAAEILAEIESRPGPAVLLCSDYVWTLHQNLDLVIRARRACPDLLVVHGGPSCPERPEAATDFLRRHVDLAHVLVRGEGELALAEILEALGPGLPTLDTGRLAGVAGLTYLDRGGEVVRTPDRPRIADLDALPSPYLTGEFDHVAPEAWTHVLAVETSRGCPYGCTFCDWGSATRSRIRLFDQARVRAELEWAADKGVETIILTDANFGILRRDVETAGTVADIHRRTGHPRLLAYYPAKNTTRHLVPIMDLLLDSGVAVSGALSLQTTDAATLAAIDRSNIDVDGYVALAREFRRRGLPVLGELMIGLPEQTYDAYRRDLQFLLDLEVEARTWRTQLLPNAPMSEPGYQHRWGIGVDDRMVVQTWNTAGPGDLDRMLRLRKVHIIADHLGVLRHLLRVVQWDHGVDATVVMDHLIDAVHERPGSFPSITWLIEYFDLHPSAPVGWRALYAEFLRFLEAELGIADDSGLRCAVEVQVALMPAPGRTFPTTVELEHDYVSYYRAATSSLYTDGRPGRPPMPLVAYPPARLTVDGDPLDLCGEGVHFRGDPRDDVTPGAFYIGGDNSQELTSPLMRVVYHVANEGIRPVTAAPADVPATPVPVRVGSPGRAIR